MARRAGSERAMMAALISAQVQAMTGEKYQVASASFSTETIMDIMRKTEVLVC